MTDQGEGIFGVSATVGSDSSNNRTEDATGPPSAAAPAGNADYDQLTPLVQLQELWDRAAAADAVDRRGNLDVIPDNDGSGLLAVCHLVALQPFSLDGAPWNAVGTYESIASLSLAAAHFNTGNGSIVPSLNQIHERCPVRVSLMESLDTALDERTAVDAVIQATDPAKQIRPCAFFGALRSAVSIGTSVVTGLRGYPQISSGSTADQLDDKTQHPLFGRTIPSERGNAMSYVLFLQQHLKVRYAAVLHADDEFGESFVTGVRVAVDQFAPDMVLRTVEIPSTNELLTQAILQSAIQELKQTQFTYIIGAVYAYQIDQVLLEAYRQGIAGTGQHTWMFPQGLHQVPGTSVKRDSPLAQAYRGLLEIGLYDFSQRPEVVPAALAEARTAVRESENDMEYVRSKLPNQGLPFTAQADFLSSADPASIYDLVVALGLAACRAVKGIGNNLTMDGPSHFEAFKEIQFEGASGTLQFDKVTGTREPLSATYGLSFYVLDPTQSNDTHVVYQQRLGGMSQGQEWDISTPIVFNDGTTNIPPDLPGLDVEKNLLTVGLRAGSLLMCSLVLLQALVFGGWTLYHRHHGVVRRSQPFFLFLICAGATMMGLSIVPLGVDEGVCRSEISQCDAACMTFPWLLSIGFTVLFSALFTKTHRLKEMIRSSLNATRVVLTPWDVLKPMVVLLSANLLVLSLWTAMDPLRYETKVVAVDSSFNRPTETYGVCRAEDSAAPYAGTLTAINISALVFTVYEAARSTGFSTEYDESRYITMSILCIVLISIVGVPVTILTSGSPTAYYYVISSMIFVTSTLVLWLIFFPKIRAWQSSVDDGAPEVFGDIGLHVTERENQRLQATVRRLKNNNRALKQRVEGLTGEPVANSSSSNNNNRQRNILSAETSSVFRGILSRSKSKSSNKKSSSNQKNSSSSENQGRCICMSNPVTSPAGPDVQWNALADQLLSSESSEDRWSILSEYLKNARNKREGWDALAAKVQAIRTNGDLSPEERRSWDALSEILKQIPNSSGTDSTTGNESSASNGDQEWWTRLAALMQSISSESSVYGPRRESQQSTSSGSEGDQGHELMYV